MKNEQIKKLARLLRKYKTLSIKFPEDDFMKISISQYRFLLRRECLNEAARTMKCFLEWIYK